MNFRVKVFQLFLLPLVLGLGATHAYCQDAPKIALFTGYSYMHRLPVDYGVALNGWNAGLMFKLTPRIQLAANVAGNYGSSFIILGVSGISRTEPTSPFVSLPNVRIRIAQVGVHEHSLLFGPAFRLWRKRGISVNLLAGAGLGEGNADRPFGLFLKSGEAEPELPSKIGFAAGGGVSADVSLTDRISYRVIQAEFVATRLGFGGWQRNIRFAAGLVLKLTK